MHWKLAYPAAFIPSADRRLLPLAVYAAAVAFLVAFVFLA